MHFDYDFDDSFHVAEAPSMVELRILWRAPRVSVSLLLFRLRMDDSASRANPILALDINFGTIFDMDKLHTANPLSSSVVKAPVLTPLLFLKDLHDDRYHRMRPM
jgi:hypothetical protein